MLRHEWILDYRAAPLTEFFLMTPFLTSGLFYLSIIAVGYWLKPGRDSVFAELGFLVPFSTLINIILKNSFAISRPDISLHLTKVESMLGFPSGDVQVAVVFWGMCYFRWKGMLLVKIVAPLVVLLTMIARLYLGVHSFADVIAGLFFGLLIVYVWRMRYIQAVVEKWFFKEKYRYWGVVVIALTIYFLVVEENVYTTIFMASVGTLLGYGLSLRSIYNQEYMPQMFTGRHMVSIALSYIMTIILFIAIPTMGDTENVQIVSRILEVTLIVFLVFSVFPYLQRVISQKG